MSYFPELPSPAEVFIVIAIAMMIGFIGGFVMYILWGYL